MTELIIKPRPNHPSNDSEMCLAPGSCEVPKKVVQEVEQPVYRPVPHMAVALAAAPQLGMAQSIVGTAPAAVPVFTELQQCGLRQKVGDF